MEQEHKRRVRYKGTHPRKYQEKYKELNPEKYQRDVEKILQQGKTPAGMHIPICVEEILQFFDIQPGQIGWMPPWDMVATAGGCWKNWVGRDICTPQMWTPLNLKRPGFVWDSWGMDRKSSQSGGELCGLDQVAARRCL